METASSCFVVVVLLIWTHAVSAFTCDIQADTHTHTHSVLPYTNRNLTTVLSCLGLLTSLRRQGCSDKVAFTEATCLHNSVMDN